MRRFVPLLAVAAVVGGLAWALSGDDEPEATDTPVGLRWDDDEPDPAEEGRAPSARAARRPSPTDPNPSTGSEPRRVVPDEGWDPGATRAVAPETIYPPNPSGITAALDGIAPEIQECWSRIQERDDSLPPILQVKFTLQPPPDPSAERAVIDEIGLVEGGPEDPELLSCVRNHVMNLPVAAPVGDAVEMVHPFAFGTPPPSEGRVDAGQ